MWFDHKSVPYWLCSHFNLHIGSMACPTFLWEPALGSGQRPSASFWWLQMPFPLFVTSHVLQRKPSPHSSASSSSTRPWRNLSTWETTIPSTRTTTSTNSPRTRMWTLIYPHYLVQSRDTNVITIHMSWRYCKSLMEDYSLTQMFICLHRCSCVEPSDPTNATLKYWEMTNVTASEIYWEALETKVLEYIRPH